MTNSVAYGYRSKKFENYYDKIFEQPELQDSLSWVSNDGDVRKSLYENGVDYIPLLINRTRENGMQFFASFGSSVDHQGQTFSHQGQT